jgi:two-component system response regulator AtoC
MTLPSLRERPDDIPLLIKHFLAKYNHKFSKKIEGVDPQAREVLLAYAYPGNVRELENIIERAVALAEGTTLHADDLPPDLREYSVTPYGEWTTLEDQERDYIHKVLRHTRFNMGETAQILGLPRTTLWRKLKRYGLLKSA